MMAGITRKATKQERIDCLNKTIASLKRDLAVKDSGDDSYKPKRVIEIQNSIEKYEKILEELEESNEESN